MLGLALWLLKGPSGSYSATSIAALAAGLALLGGLLWQARRGNCPGRAVMAIILVLLMFLGVTSPFGSGINLAAFSSTLGRDETLTGRTEIWLDFCQRRCGILS